MWYLRDDIGRYYTGSEWSAERESRKLYRERVIAMLIRRVIGGFIYRVPR